jgi:hypothetical protein
VDSPWFGPGELQGGGGAHDGRAAEEYDVLLRLVDSCGTVEKSGTCCDELWQPCCDNFRYLNTPWISGRGAPLLTLS